MLHELVEGFHDYCEEAGYFGPNGNSLWLWIGEDTLDDSDPNYVDRIVAVLADPIKFLAHRLAATGELAKATDLTVYAEPHMVPHTGEDGSKIIVLYKDAFVVLRHEVDWTSWRGLDDEELDRKLRHMLELLRHGLRWAKLAEKVTGGLT